MMIDVLEDLTPTEHIESRDSWTYKNYSFNVIMWMFGIKKKQIVIINSGISIQEKKRGNIFRDIIAHRVKRHVT